MTTSCVMSRRSRTHRRIAARRPQSHEDGVLGLVELPFGIIVELHSIELVTNGEVVQVRVGPAMAAWKMSWSLANLTPQGPARGAIPGVNALEADAELEDRLLRHARTLRVLEHELGFRGGAKSDDHSGASWS